MTRVFVASMLALVAVQTWALDLAGVVVGPDDKAIEGATVWIAQERQVRHTTTDAQGAFTFKKLPAVPATLVARKDGYALSGIAAPVVGGVSARIQLLEAASLSIHIKNEKYEPIEGAYLRGMYVGDAFNVPVESLATDGFPEPRSGAEGLMVIPNLPKDSHVRFVLGHRDHPDVAVAYLPVTDKIQTILMYPGVKLRGRVTVDGKGVAGALVTAYKLGSGAQNVAGDFLTDSEGFYHMTLKPDDYALGVRHPDYASPKTRTITVGDDPDANVADLVMEVPRVIEGSVLAPDGKPAPGILVSYWIGEDEYQETLTQQDGHFRLLPPDVEGRVRVLAPDGVRTEHFGDIPIKAPLQAETKLSPIKLVALPVIEGKVSDADGKPQTNVLIASRNLAPPVWAITDAAGAFRIQFAQAPMQPSAEFRAEHGRHFLRADFEVSLETPAPVSVTLQPFEPDLATREVLKGQDDLTALVGKPAPPLTCDAWFNATNLDLESLKGKVVVLTFWGGFEDRGPIRDCIEELRALYDLFKESQDVMIVLVHDSGKEPDEIKEIVKSFNMPFPVGHDKDPYTTYERYGIHYIPETILIDKHGVLRYFQTEGRLLSLIDSLRREA